MNYLTKYKKWLESEKVDDFTKNTLKTLSGTEIKECFSTDLEFGTGGLRGIMFPGTNRLNIYTIRQATQGLANEILLAGKKHADKGVVIAYDSRHNSEIFAKETANVLAANNIKVFLFDSLRPTPELSFAVRHLGCYRGIVITASHNPKEYNGYKVYGEDGGQITPEVAKNIMNHIKNTDIFDDVKLSGHMPVFLKDEIDKSYINAMLQESFNIHIPEKFKVVYTPLHGSGNKLVKQILKKIGVKNLYVVQEQEQPDGNFPTVESPNPENPEAFDIAIKYAKETNADLVIGTDPDSDRLGAVIKNNNGDYITLSGNQTGCILCDYILRKSKETGILPDNGVIVKTIVTTELARKIAENYNVETYDVLTGFKYIGETIKNFESNKDGKRFIFGFEESFGYLKGTYTRDKDAVLAAMLLCEAAADSINNGTTLYKTLDAIYKKYGHFKEELKSITLKGIDGQIKIKAIMDYFRKGYTVAENELMIDYANGIDNLPKADVLKFKAKNTSVTIRPSGTEPKIKLYFETNAKSEATANEQLQQIKNKFLNIISNLC